MWTDEAPLGTIQLEMIFMGRSVLVVQNITREGPGLLSELLTERGLTMEIVNLDRGDDFPDPRSYRGVVVLGGPDSANDTTPKMVGELARVHEILEAGMPYLGVCLGLQVLVKAGGGQVVKNHVREIDFFDQRREPFTVELTAAGRTDPLFRDVPKQFRVFHLHGETVEPTNKMTLLGRGQWCEQQVVRVSPKAVGLQFHLELTPAMLDQWLAEDDDLKQLNANAGRDEFNVIQTEYRTVGRQVLSNFLDSLS